MTKELLDIIKIKQECRIFYTAKQNIYVLGDRLIEPKFANYSDVTNLILDLKREETKGIMHHYVLIHNVGWRHLEVYGYVKAHGTLDRFKVDILPEKSVTRFAELIL